MFSLDKLHFPETTMEGVKEEVRGICVYGSVVLSLVLMFRFEGRKAEQ